MPKRVFIVHCWGGTPKDNWYPWLKSELEKRGFKVEVPVMPDTNNPKIETWVPFLAKMVGKLDKDTYFVGHSMGCPTIMRYFENVKQPVGGVVFVAGFFTLTTPPSTTDEDKKTLKPWLDTPVDCSKIKKVARKIVAIFSDNDPWVPVENAQLFKNKLNAKIIIEKGQEHYSNGRKTLTIALNELLTITK